MCLSHGYCAEMFYGRKESKILGIHNENFKLQISALSLQQEQSMRSTQSKFGNRRVSCLDYSNYAGSSSGQWKQADNCFPKVVQSRWALFHFLSLALTCIVLIDFASYFKEMLRKAGDGSHYENWCFLVELLLLSQVHESSSYTDIPAGSA